MEIVKRVGTPIRRARNVVASLCLALGLVGPLTPGLAQAQAVITPTDASSTTFRTTRSLNHAINGNGLSSDGSSANVLTETHLQPGSATEYYFSEDVIDDDANFTSTTETFIFTMPGRVTVDRVHQWVYSGSRGIKSVDMAFSTDGGATYPTTITVGDFTAPSDPASSETIMFAQQTGVTHIRFTNIETFSSTTYLSSLELRFGGPIELSGTAVDSVTYNSARLKTTLAAPNTDAAVTAYWWKTGDSATNSMYLGAWTNETSTNLSHAISSSLEHATYYSFAFRATNDTMDVWSLTETFLTGVEGTILAEYEFGGSVASSDAESGTAASDVSFAGLPDPENLSYLQIGAEEIGSTFPGGSTNYFTFTLDTGSTEVSLTGLEWDYGMAGGYSYEVGIFADAYLGFTGSGNYIPGTYASGGADVSLAMTRYAADLSAHAGLQTLSNTSVVFRVYLADGASLNTREYRYDNIRVYGTIASTAGTVFMFQ